MQQVSMCSPWRNLQHNGGWGLKEVVALGESLKEQADLKE